MLRYVVNILLFFYLWQTPLCAYDSKTAAIIYEKIFRSFSSDKEIEIFTKSEFFSEIFKYSDKLRRVDTPLKADITVVTNVDEIPENRSIRLFATDVTLIKKSPSVIGAFYWDHGRPKIVFVGSRLKHYNIDLDPYFKKYIQDEL